jgi:hypothetical protein
MPLTGSDSVLSAALRAALLSDPETGAVDDSPLTAFCDKIAATVIAHITANATLVVAAGIPVATTGTAAAQTGATTAPGTGTIT